MSFRPPPAAAPGRRLGSGLHLSANPALAAAALPWRNGSGWGRTLRRRGPGSHRLDLRLGQRMLRPAVEDELADRPTEAGWHRGPSPALGAFAYVVAGTHAICLVVTFL